MAVDDTGRGDRIMSCATSILQVTAGWDEGLRAEGAAAQAASLQRLAAALDRLEGVDLAGVHIMLGAASGVDHRGQAWLRTTDSTAEWVRCAPSLLLLNAVTRVAVVQVW